MYCGIVCLSVCSLRCGLGKVTGCVCSGEESLGQVADISPELAMTAMGECEDLLLAAEAKAFYGLGRNWDALTALVLALEEKEKINRKEFEEVSPPLSFPRPPPPQMPHAKQQHTQWLHLCDLALHVIRAPAQHCKQDGHAVIGNA